MTTYVLLNFLPLGSKYCNTNERSMLNTKGTMLRNKSHSMVILGQPMNFSADPRIFKQFYFWFYFGGTAILVKLQWVRNGSLLVYIYIYNNANSRFKNLLQSTSRIDSRQNPHTSYFEKIKDQWCLPIPTTINNQTTKSPTFPPLDQDRS